MARNLLYMFLTILFWSLSNPFSQFFRTFALSLEYNLLVIVLVKTFYLVSMGNKEFLKMNFTRYLNNTHFLLCNISSDVRTMIHMKAMLYICTIKWFCNMHCSILPPKHLKSLNLYCIRFEIHVVLNLDSVKCKN